LKGKAVVKTGMENLTDARF